MRLRLATLAPGWVWRRASRWARQVGRCQVVRGPVNWQLVQNQVNKVYQVKQVYHEKCTCRYWESSWRALVARTGGKIGSYRLYRNQKQKI